MKTINEQDVIELIKEEIASYQPLPYCQFPNWPMPWPRNSSNSRIANGGQLPGRAVAPILKPGPEPKGLNDLIGRDVIVRTYSAGVWFGTLKAKDGNEVHLVNARRMWSWYVAKDPDTGARGISLSSLSIHGLDYTQSQIEQPVEIVWLEAIEIIPCTERAINSIKAAPYAKA